MCVCLCVYIYIYIYIYIFHWPRGSGRPRFNPMSRHSKDFKNGT